MKRIKYLILTLGLVAGFGLATLPVNVGAQGTVTDEACKNAPESPLCKTPAMDAAAFVKMLVNVLLYVLGAVCVVVIIISGFFYATAGGDATLITKAKNTLLYAVVGLIVAILAYAIVNFVITRFEKAPATTASVSNGRQILP